MYKNDITNKVRKKINIPDIRSKVLHQADRFQPHTVSSSDALKSPLHSIPCSRFQSSLLKPVAPEKQ